MRFSPMNCREVVEQIRLEKNLKFHQNEALKSILKRHNKIRSFFKQYPKGTVKLSWDESPLNYEQWRADSLKALHRRINIRGGTLPLTYLNRDFREDHQNLLYMLGKSRLETICTPRLFLTSCFRRKFKDLIVKHQKTCTFCGCSNTFPLLQGGSHFFCDQKCYLAYTGY